MSRRFARQGGRAAFRGRSATGTAAGVPELVKAAAATLAVLQGIAGDYPALLAATRCDLAGLDSVATDRERANVLRTAAVVTVTIEAGFAAGLDLAQRALALSAGNHHQRMHCTWPVLASLYHLGRWVDLRPVLADHVRAVEQEPAYGCHFVRDGAIIGATVAAHQGDRAAARALAAPIGDPLADLDSASAWQARFALAMGDPATARQISAAKALEGRLYGPQHAVALIEALVELQDWVGLLEFMPAARGSIAGNQMLAPHCDRAAGRADMAVGRPREAGRHLRRALAGFEELSVPFEAARTRELLAALATGARARAFLEPALATYLELGARPLARRLMHRLAQA